MVRMVNVMTVKASQLEGEPHLRENIFATEGDEYWDWNMKGKMNRKERVSLDEVERRTKGEGIMAEDDKIGGVVTVGGWATEPKRSEAMVEVETKPKKEEKKVIVENREVVIEQLGEEKVEFPQSEGEATTTQTAVSSKSGHDKSKEEVTRGKEGDSKLCGKGKISVIAVENKSVKRKDEGEREGERKKEKEERRQEVGKETRSEESRMVNSKEKECKKEVQVIMESVTKCAAMASFEFERVSSDVQECPNEFMVVTSRHNTMDKGMRPVIDFLPSEAKLLQKSEYRESNENLFTIRGLVVPPDKERYSEKAPLGSYQIVEIPTGGMNDVMQVQRVPRCVIRLSEQEREEEFLDEIRIRRVRERDKSVEKSKVREVQDQKEMMERRMPTGMTRCT
jgi:hypothetical protein